MGKTKELDAILTIVKLAAYNSIGMVVAVDGSGMLILKNKFESLVILSLRFFASDSGGQIENRECSENGVCTL